MENLERQIEEIGVLEAIYPDELTVDTPSIELARQRLEVEIEDSSNEKEKSELPNLSLTMRLAGLSILEPGGKLKHSHPSITLEFPPGYPESSPPTLISTAGFDAQMMVILKKNLAEHSGEECTMQIVMSINDEIQTRNESTEDEYNEKIQKKEQKKLSDLAAEKKSNSKPILGRRIINSPYILKPAKIKDIKKCADELGLGGYAKVGKPGIIVIEGLEEDCKQYCPMLEDRGWKYQKVQGQEMIEGQAGRDIDELRAIHNGAGGFEVLGENATISDISKLCKDAGIGDLFFSSLNIHDSSTQKGSGTDATPKKGGKKH